MKPWGPSKVGVLLALLLIVSGAVVLPGSVQAQGKLIWGTVRDCADFTVAVAAQVTLVDVHGQLPPINDTTDSQGIFQFPVGSPPGHFVIQVRPSGSSHYTKEDGPFRFDGTEVVFRAICVTKMPTKNRSVEITVLDAQPTFENQSVDFASFPRGSENITESDPDHRYSSTNNSFTVSTRPIAWGSPRLLYVGPGVPRGIFLKPNDFDYTTAMAFNGTIKITNTTVQAALANWVNNGTFPGSGWVTVTYRNVSRSSVLAHGYISGEKFFRNDTLLNPYTPHLALNRERGEVTLTSTLWHYGVDRLRVEYNWSKPVPQAQVSIIDAVRKQPIQEPLTTGSSGRIPTTAYDGTYDVRIEHRDYRTQVFNLIVAGDVRRTFNITGEFRVTALAVDAETEFPITSGLAGVMINTNPFVNPGERILLASASSSGVTFHAHSATYLLIVDANGYEASTQSISVTGSTDLGLIALKRSPQELVTTEIGFRSSTDLGNLTVFRNVTLLKDSVFPAIGNASVRNLDWQIDLRFGTSKDGNIGSDALEPFNAYLNASGPFYVVTEQFFSVDGKTYISQGPYTVNVFESGTNGTNLTIRSRQDYRLKDPSKPIKANEPRYTVEVTGLADVNQTVYQNYSFLVRLPRSYEMTSKTTTGQIETRGFVNVTVDPLVDAVVPRPRVNMIVEKSRAGVAGIEVEGPVGKVYIKNRTNTSYLAWVANDTAIVFSANSTQAANAKDATFMWSFRNRTTQAEIGTRQGIWTTFNFGTPGEDYRVNLTVTQVNPTNVTWHQIDVTVDSEIPRAMFTNNRSGTSPLTVPEDMVTSFDANPSTDLLWNGFAGEIAEWNWDFESDGIVDRTGKTPTFNYSKPGTFKMNLTVVDRVGHKSLNATLSVTVRDTTGPVPQLVILDENSWREPTQLAEGKRFWFNVSQTTDNSLNRTEDNVNLTYTYNWGDTGPSNKTGPGTGRTMLNVSHTYERHGEYKLSIEVKDAAGNRGWLNRTLTVQANVSAHPDLSIEPGSLKITPTSPEEGQLVTFRFVVKNAAGRVNATRFNLQFVLIRGTEQNLTGQVTGIRYLKSDGNTADRIEPNKNITVEFQWASPDLGNKSLRIKFSDGDEPPAFITGANEVSTSLVVREAGWKFWAWVGAFVFIIFGLPIIYYVIRKVRAGELHLPRRRREEAAEEEEEEEDEEDEEDEDEDDRKVAEDRKKRL